MYHYPIKQRRFAGELRGFLSSLRQNRWQPLHRFCGYPSKGERKLQMPLHSEVRSFCNSDLDYVLITNLVRLLSFIHRVIFIFQFASQRETSHRFVYNFLSYFLWTQLSSTSSSNFNEALTDICCH